MDRRWLAEDETPRAIGLFLGLSALGIALGPLAAGAVIEAFLRPETPHPAVPAALLLVGAGNIAAVSPVTEIVLASVPKDRAGSAAALNNAARSPAPGGRRWESRRARVRRSCPRGWNVAVACALLASFGVRPGPMAHPPESR